MASNPHSITNPAQVAAEQVQCYEHRLAGKSVRTIAKLVGLPPSTVHNRIQAEIGERVIPLAEEVRKMELDRYDTWLETLMDKLAAGEDPLKVIPVAVKVSERRARLLGLDAPVAVDVAGELKVTVEAVNLEQLK